MLLVAHLIEATREQFLSANKTGLLIQEACCLVYSYLTVLKLSFHC